MMLRFMTKSRASRRVFSVRVVRRLARREDGASAIEFGVLAFPFIFLLAAIVDTALFLLAGQTLETAVTDTGRLIMTGQAQEKKLTQTTFKDAVCARLQGGLFNCQSSLHLDVQTKPSFSGFDRTTPYDAAGKFQPNKVSFQPGGPNDIVLVRAFYQWPMFVSVLTGGNRLLVATAVFRNEPFAAN
jgi:Flp pilus assembly protein TadG